MNCGARGVRRVCASRAGLSPRQVQPVKAASKPASRAGSLPPYDAPSKATEPLCTNKNNNSAASQSGVDGESSHAAESASRLDPGDQVEATVAGKTVSQEVSSANTDSPIKQLQEPELEYGKIGLAKIAGSGPLSIEELASKLGVPHDHRTRDLLEKIRIQHMLTLPSNRALTESVLAPLAGATRQLAQQTSFTSHMSISEDGGSVTDDLHERVQASMPREVRESGNKPKGPRTPGRTRESHRERRDSEDLAESISARDKVKNFLEHYTDPNMDPHRAGPSHY